MDREGQLPVADSVRIATEVAEALAHAHSHGVIHRDIKPENILLQGGHPLLADFGIALAVQEAGGARLTQTGLSLGTPQYMSPEQAAAEKTVDGRTDIYSLGAVVYEMLAGEPPLTAPTTQALIAKLMAEEPRPLASLRRTVPDHVADAVHTALEKLPADRFAGAAEFSRALVHPTATTAHRPAAVSPLRRRAVLLAGLAGVALGAVAGAILAGFGTGSHPTVQPPSRLAILAPNVGGSGSPALRRQLALTPDGESVIYVAISATGTNEMMRQRLDQEAPSQIAGASGMAGPSVSWDGRWLFASGATGSVRVPIDGGTPVRLPEIYMYGAVGPDGSLWHSEVPEGLARLAQGADSIENRFTELGPGIRMMQVLDARTAIVVRRHTGNANGPPYLLDLETGDTTALLDVPVAEIRETGGCLVWVLLDGTMHAATWDPKTRRRGNPVPVATGLSLTGTGIAQFAASRNGTVAYIPEAPRELVFVTRDGGTRLATPERRNFHAPLFSPDGRRLSVDFTSSDGRDVWLLSPDQGALSRVTFVGDGHDATWSPDGRYLYWTSIRNNILAVFRSRPGSTMPPESIITEPRLAYTGAWMPSGEMITVGQAGAPGSRLDVFRLPAGGTALEPLVATAFDDHYPIVSPDHRWLAYVSNQSGRDEVYVRGLGAGDEVAVQVSLGGGTEPVWRRDGRELAYRGTTEGKPELMVAELGAGPDFTVTARRTLFSLDDYVSTSPHANYDYTPDGRGFVMVRRSAATRIMVIQNLPELVRRLQGAASN
jgi:serine/threonine-protein kinase